MRYRMLNVLFAQSFTQPLSEILVFGARSKGLSKPAIAMEC